jgi:lactate dehydrogenase-like 2-hydroxyacid dehydrogenase
MLQLCDIEGLNHLAKPIFRELKPVQTFKGTTREEFLKACQDGSWSDVVALYRSNESTSLTGPFDTELVSKLPPSLKFICHNGAGYDNIDVAACSTHGLFNVYHLHTHD